VGIQVKLHSRTDVIIVDGDQITYAEDGKVLEILNEGSEIIATFRDWEYAILQEPYERPLYRALDEDEEDEEDEEDDELYEDDEEVEDDVPANGNGSAGISNEEIARVITEAKLLSATPDGAAFEVIESENQQQHPQP
jgi:hypothetical protein